MEQKRRQRNNSSNDDDNKQKKKIQVTTTATNNQARETVACFEDLSNDLLYEVFEYLDFYHVYNGFFSLNTRFHHFIAHSSLPIHIRLSLISKSAFQRYNHEIIVPNLGRITSLYIFNICLYDYQFSSCQSISRFNELKTLQLVNIESAHLDNLLGALVSLKKLSSLTLSVVDCVRDIDPIYRQIFRLPTLKYCNCWFKEGTDYYSLPAATNQYSSIEHLIIHNSIYIQEVNSLLSYVPQLHHLQLHSVRSCYPVEDAETCSPVLKYLTHLSLDLISCNFNEFEQMIINVGHDIKVLRITIHSTYDRTYPDANRWQQLLSSHMPNLRIFDFRYEFWPNPNPLSTNNEHELALPRLIDQFTSAFGTERQWFFTQQWYQSTHFSWTIFHSTDSYRRKSYTLDGPIKKRTCLNSFKTHLKSVQRILIQQEEDIDNCQNYFPNASQVTFECRFRTVDHSIAPMLGRIMPLNQLTKLVSECYPFYFHTLIDLLRFTPHLHILIVRSMSLYGITQTTIEKDEVFHLVSRTNTIRDVTLRNKCTLDELQLLVALCPRLQHLTVRICAEDLQSVIQFLLDKTNPNTRHLFPVCLLMKSENSLTIVENLIKSKTLLDDYVLKRVKEDLYLWW